MNTHNPPDNFRPIGDIAPSAIEQEIIKGMADEILTLRIPLSDPMRIANGLAERGFISAIINPHLDAAIALARDEHVRQAT